MPYISLISSWKNNDIESIAHMIDDHVTAYYINELGEAQPITKSVLIQMLRRRMSQIIESDDLQWNFEMIHRAQVHDGQMIIFYVYSVENPDYQKTRKTLVAMTFGHNHSNNPRIKTIYITTNVTEIQA
ncbi:hypothetical protein [Staphylococcus lutrae]|uniref:Uncharacterized protein n=1 Tax=Staphylococcus lutrae TaxID=155085 RepID=A0AAC9WM09_9STAP|nr:hypothetical protein [Staphylococcus lutrae]ARJ50192.1 hypothetical protein B5P37_02065 [Staphylococcus lutrae]PNZ39347.1 hypothetical protein CD134_01535 [Staphylococcus lutrae]